MEPIKITDNIYWVGAVDYDIRDFHGYLTPHGSTYNAYLIVDKKITLIDAVKHGFEDELLSRISKVVDPSKIDQVVSNHAEMDHSGALPGTLRAIGIEKPVYASAMGVKNLSGQFKGAGLNIKPIAGPLDVGSDNLVFVETRMIHWPDSMFSFLPSQGVLFSQDGFGMHLAAPERFDDEVDEDFWRPLALNYFANILTPYTAQIAKVLEKVTADGLVPQIKVICPDHGFVWRKDPAKILSLYSELVQQKPKRKAVIVFDTMWHSTEYMARELTDHLSRQGIETHYYSLKNRHRSAVATECYEAAAIIVGSPTINNQMFPSVADLLCYLKSLKMKNKIAAAFGSHGWSGEGAKLVQAELKTMGYNVPFDEVRVQWVPNEQDLLPLKALGQSISEEIKKVAGDKA
ncbi:MAG: flavodoxin domain-containing protein [Deltaproteobacteria bacterium]|jgi:flavorubredoxin|nr:flavodoxin domain-containing protein [Deltaproteobacteria bacterium]